MLLRTSSLSLSLSLSLTHTQTHTHTLVTHTHTHKQHYRYAVAELGEDIFGQLAWPDENIPRPQRSPRSLLKKKSSRPLSSTLSNVWSSFRGLSSIDSTEKDQETEDELFFKDLYASSWMQRIFTRTRRLSQKMSKLRAIKHDMSKQALIDRLCMGYMDLENKRVRVLIQGPFLQIYEAGQDFRSRFPLYVWYSSSL